MNGFLERAPPSIFHANGKEKRFTLVTTLTERMNLSLEIQGRTEGKNLIVRLVSNARLRFVLFYFIFCCFCSTLFVLLFLFYFVFIFVLFYFRFVFHLSMEIRRRSSKLSVHVNWLSFAYVVSSLSASVRPNGQMTSPRQCGSIPFYVVAIPPNSMYGLP